MKYHTKVGIISIIIILLLMVISLIMSLSGYFPLAYEIYTKGFSGLGFIFVGDIVYMTGGSGIIYQEDVNYNFNTIPKNIKDRFIFINHRK